MSPRKLPASAFIGRRAPITSLCTGSLHRAIVELPEALTTPEYPLQERVVFFEVPANREDGRTYLRELLSKAWAVDTADWAHHGLISGVASLHELVTQSFGDSAHEDIRLFETGAGGNGPEAVGFERVHYARAHTVDLFVSPRVAARLNEAMAVIEAMYQQEPARRRAELGDDVGASVPFQHLSSRFSADELQEFNNALAEGISRMIELGQTPAETRDGALAKRWSAHKRLSMWINGCVSEPSWMADRDLAVRAAITAPKVLPDADDIDR